MRNKKINLISVIENILLILIFCNTFSDGNKLGDLATTYKYAFILIPIVLIVMSKKRLNFNFAASLWIIFATYNFLGKFYALDAKQLNIMLGVVFCGIILVLYKFDENKLAFFLKAMEVYIIFGSITVCISYFWHTFAIDVFGFFISDVNKMRIISEARGNTFSGIFSTNGNAAFLIGMGLGILFTKKFANVSFNKFDGVKFIIYIVALLLCNKRALLVFPFVVYLIIFIINKNKINVLKVYIGVSVVFLIILLFFDSIYTMIPIFNRFVTDGDNRRTDFKTVCVEMFEEKPLLGYGLNSFNTYLYNLGYRVYAEATQNGVWIYHAHNVYYQVLAENGAIGFVLYMITIFSVLIHSIKYTTKNKDTFTDDQKRILNFSIFVQLIYIMYSLTGNPLYVRQQIVLYLFAVAMLFSIKKDIKLNEVSVKNKNDIGIDLEYIKNLSLTK